MCILYEAKFEEHVQKANKVKPVQLHKTDEQHVFQSETDVRSEAGKSGQLLYFLK